MPEPRVFDLEFIEIDFWSKPVWKVQDKEVYFCSVDVLIPNEDLKPNCTIEEINDYFNNNQDKVVLLGGAIDDDPDGRKASNWSYNFINPN